MIHDTFWHLRPWLKIFYLYTKYDCFSFMFFVFIHEILYFIHWSIDMLLTQKNLHSKINALTLRPVFDISIDPGSVIGGSPFRWVFAKIFASSSLAKYFMYSWVKGCCNAIKSDDWRLSATEPRYSTWNCKNSMCYCQNCLKWNFLLNITHIDIIDNKVIILPLLPMLNH